MDLVVGMMEKNRPVMLITHWWRHATLRDVRPSQISIPHFWRYLSIQQRTSTYINLKNLSIITISMFVLPGGERVQFDSGMRLEFCMIGNVSTDSWSWVRIFLAEICIPVLTARFVRVVCGYNGGCNKHKSCPGQSNPPTSASLWRWQGGISLPVAL